MEVKNASPLSGRCVIHISMLESRGGAARIAQTLRAGLRDKGVGSGALFEFSDSGERTGPSGLAEKIFSGPGGDKPLLHLHSWSDWGELFPVLRPWAGNIVVTLHDLSLFTGGCPYPLDCVKFGRGCADPCPRGFVDSERVRRERQGLLRELDPVLVSPSSWLKREIGGAAGIAVIPNGVDWPSSLPDKNQAKRGLGFSREARVVLFAAHGGEGAAYKSGREWRGLWRELKRLIPAAAGLMAGGEESGRDGDLLIFPYVDKERMRLFMNAADILLYPTLADNHPLVVLEAMGSGCVPVCYAVGGVVEQIASGLTGMLAPPGEPEELLKAAASLLGSPAKAGKIGAAAFARGRERFSRERMILDYLKLYGKLAG